LWTGDAVLIEELPLSVRFRGNGDRIGGGGCAPEERWQGGRAGRRRGAVCVLGALCGPAFATGPETTPGSTEGRHTRADGRSKDEPDAHGPPGRQRGACQRQY
jgi:hypothetical protein